ncbi:MULTISPECIES: Mov34/MPN/PAD-1 family protein [unclassified Bradyrhizobium]|uniref:Mov34/MPN/PAD-1 family protein n=1 Tax=unclassified Bradyrhizobium TaxID=2631580 RepID=UPI002916A6D6|nr:MULTISPECIES: Mov34/MPN/PAD-1 family protein [unclassified Bradyrhizobium]
MMRLADVRTVRVPRNCAEAVHAHMRKVGRQGFEGLALWAGTQTGEIFTVQEAVIPAQKHIRTEDGVCVITEAQELHRLNVWLYRRKLSLIAQIHSHPGRAYHSSTDNKYAVATTVGCFSLVMPDFAVGPFTIDRLASYRLDASGAWRGISASQAVRMITIVE